MDKITKEEKEMLIEKRLIKMNENKQYRFQLFKTYYKENPKTNLKAWNELDEKGKTKILKQITKFENQAFLFQGKSIYGMKIPSILKFVIECKHKQLVEFGIRK